MLSYQHIYHAGNFADVQKHSILCLLLKALAVKEKPFFVLDAFAGRGGYQLTSHESNKTGEYHLGIEKIWEQPKNHILLKPYLNAVKAFNTGASLTSYPGSPWLIRHFLRPQDRMALCELHPAELEALRTFIASEKHVKLYKRDAYDGIKGLLPPKERRGLLLLDPSYETKSEYLTIAETIIETYKHWREGTYVIWYPILPENNHEKLRIKLKHSGIRKILDCTLMVNDLEQGMNGTGMMIINPPWHLKEQVEKINPWLLKTLATSEAASHKVSWLVPE